MCCALLPALFHLVGARRGILLKLVYTCALLQPANQTRKRCFGTASALATYSLWERGDTDEEILAGWRHKMKGPLVMEYAVVFRSCCRAVPFRFVHLSFTGYSDPHRLPSRSIASDPSAQSSQCRKTHQFHDKQVCFGSVFQFLDDM